MNDPESRYAAWFHELDAWTEYWDIYHPESKGRYYFGDGNSERGLLTILLPHHARPAVFTAWTRMALDHGTAGEFLREVRVDAVAAAVQEVDDFVAALFEKHFGDASKTAVREDYLEGMFRFATDTLPPAIEREGRIAASGPPPYYSMPAAATTCSTGDSCSRSSQNAHASVLTIVRVSDSAIPARCHAMLRRMRRTCMRSSRRRLCRLRSCWSDIRRARSRRS